VFQKIKRHRKLLGFALSLLVFLSVFHQVLAPESKTLTETFTLAFTSKGALDRRNLETFTLTVKTNPAESRQNMETATLAFTSKGALDRRNLETFTLTVETSPFIASVTIQSGTAGSPVAFTADGVEYITPQTFSWENSLNRALVFVRVTNTSLTFTSWSSPSIATTSSKAITYTPATETITINLGAPAGGSNPSPSPSSEPPPPSPEAPQPTSQPPSIGFTSVGELSGPAAKDFTSVEAQVNRTRGVVMVKMTPDPGRIDFGVEYRVDGYERNTGRHIGQNRTSWDPPDPKNRSKIIELPIVAAPVPPTTTGLPQYMTGRLNSFPEPSQTRTPALE